MLFSQFIHIVKDEFLHLRIIAENWQCSSDAIFHGPALHRLDIWHNYGNDATL